MKNDDNAIELKSPEPKSETPKIVKKSPGGLASVLSQIGKKDKLTVLEKSKKDWDGYKEKEGIAEELVTYNKGKDGFVFFFSYKYVIARSTHLMENIFILGTWKSEIS